MVRAAVFSSSPYKPQFSFACLFQVDLLKKKHLLLDLVVQLTEGVVNGKKFTVPSPSKVSSAAPTSSISHESTQDSVTSDATAAKSGDLEELNSPQAGSDSDARPNSVMEDVGPAEKSVEKQKKIGWPHFQDVFMLAAINREEVETLKASWKPC